MSGYILCQTKRAQVPYYIENISTNVYSMEELCYYLYHNLYLVDKTIINEGLCTWLEQELRLGALASKLRPHLGKFADAEDVLYPIFKEINYLSLDEFRKLNQQIQKFSQEPEVLRQKLKGDYLMEHGKYVNAIKVYQKALHDKIEGSNTEKDQLGGQFIGGIYHNMGCAYARLFQMEEAITCFSRAYEHLRTMVSIKSYLYAIYMEKGIRAFAEKAAELGVDSETEQEILQEVEEAAKELFESEDGKEYAEVLEEKKKGNFDGYRKKLEDMLYRLTREYHRSTGY